MNLYDDLPPLPDYQLVPLPPLLSPIPDKLLSVLLPIIAYWILSMIFHLIDTMDLFPQYRLHTPVEVAKRNKVSRWEVVRDVIIQQIVQAAVGWILNLTEPDDFYGKEHYDVAVWARRIRLLERTIPRLLGVLGIDTVGLADNIWISYPNLAGAISGGKHQPSTTFVKWELSLAWIIYWGLLPFIQYAVAIITLDTWQYFLHRAMHMSKWMYTTFHSRHHRLYVPYAYGALYNHPFEGFLLDTLGAGFAYKLAFMNTRQGIYFFTGSICKTVDDHCGYAFPWDPLQHITSNNAGYHDVHHQSWGIKTNFSQPFFTFWDRVLGTVWTGGDVSVRYERSRLTAQNAHDCNTPPVTGTNPTESARSGLKPYQNDIKNATALDDIASEYQQPRPPPGKAQYQATSSRQQVLDDKQNGGSTIFAEEAFEEKEARDSIRKNSRKRTTSALSGKESLKGLKERMTGSMHGRTGGIIGVDGSR